LEEKEGKEKIIIKGLRNGGREGEGREGGREGRTILLSTNGRSSDQGSQAQTKAAHDRCHPPGEATHCIARCRKGREGGREEVSASDTKLLDYPPLPLSLLPFLPPSLLTAPNDSEETAKRSEPKPRD
jgi:hypothetical protein